MKKLIKFKGIELEEGTFTREDCENYFELYDSNGKEIYYENSNGDWDKWEYDDKGKQIYCEDSNGYWRKYKYDSNDNLIYVEDSNGYWCKNVYDDKGKLIYWEDLNERKKMKKLIKFKGIELEEGTFTREDSEDYFILYDSNDKEIYSEFSNGYWCKFEYDNKGKLIYYENSNGFWVKYEYDDNGNKIYYENSDGVIVDERIERNGKGDFLND